MSSRSPVSPQPAKQIGQSLVNSVYDINTSFVYLLMPVLIICFFYPLEFYFKLPWAVLFIAYGLIPKLDNILKHDWKNPTLEEIQVLEKNQRFRIVLYLTLLLDWFFLWRGLRAVYYNELTFFEMLPFMFMMHNAAAIGFLVAHELFHKENALDRIVGTVHQLKNLYMHFTIEHLYGHHKWVSTPHDPATAAQGITLYKFIPKSIVGSYLSAFKTNPFFVALSTVIEVLFVGAIWKFYDTKTMIFFLSYALGGILILELINYIEHYGLQRKLKEDGTYERVNIRHSWNAPHRLSNYLFFKLQRHSDHHENGLKPYQTLCSYEDSPQLPHGYLVCMLLACYPKKWFEIMDPLVEEYRKSDKGVNLKSLAIAEQKAEDFTDSLYLFLAGMMLSTMALKYGF